MVDLLFAEGLADTSLVFGATNGGPVLRALGGVAMITALPVLAAALNDDTQMVDIAGTIPAVSGPFELAITPSLHLSAILGNSLPALSMTYDNAVNRAPFRWAGAPWNRASARGDWCQERHQAMRSSQADARAAIGTARGHSRSVRSVWQPMIRVDCRPFGGIPWGSGRLLGVTLADGFQALAMGYRPVLALPFGGSYRLLSRLAAGWRERYRGMRPGWTLPWGSGFPAGAARVLIFGVASPGRLGLRIPWEDARTPLPGVSPRPVDPPVPPRYVGDTDLLFDDAFPASLHLVFGGPHRAPGILARVIIPILRSYLVSNDVTLLRVSNSLALPALTLSLSIDADSWVWGWQASLPATVLDDVLPSGPGDPVELEATVNGVTFRLLAEKITRDRRFAQARITVSGRGIAAELGDPYAPVVSRSSNADRTAQQLMAEALTVNGVGIGWELDWQLTDWLVPAGAWSHSGSHIEAVTRLAEAAGGYVQASRHSRTLAILPRYPAPPWDWSGLTPDYALPAAATTREAVEWLEKPAYNAVYISGEGVGILGHVTRSGTAGDLLAPMVIDALNTHADVARQRGLAILSDTGAQLLLTLETPVFSGIGIYPVGSFVAFSDNAESRLGIVRSVSIQAAFPTVRQTLEIECHE